MVFQINNRNRFRRRKRGAAVIHFTEQLNAEGRKQPCVIAECQASGVRSTVVWGHKDASVKRALATLTHQCDCPARYHNAREYEGFRVTDQG